MATPSNITNHRKEKAQLECTIAGEVELSDPHGNVDPNANWGAEPNFNLNFNLSLPNDSHSFTEAFKRQNKQDRYKDGGMPGVKGEVTMETKTTLMSPCEKQKSIIPTNPSSPTAQTTMDSHQPLPVIKQVPTLSSRLATSPKPSAVKLTSSTRTTERDRTATPKKESTKPFSVPKTEARTKSANKMTVNLIMQSSKRDCGGKISLEATPPQILNLPTTPRVHNQKGASSPISPLTNRTPEMVSKTQTTDPAITGTPTNQNPGQDSRTQGSEPSYLGPRNSQNQRTESDPLSTTSLLMTSVSPNPPSTQRYTTRTRTRNTSGSKEHLPGKDSSIRYGLKTRTKSSSSSKAKRTPKDSLSSKTSTNSKTQTGSRETLDSRSSLDSKDSLDSKTDSSSKAGPRMGPRDVGLDSGTTPQTRAEKTHKDSETVVDSRSTNNQTLKIHQNTKVSPKPKTSPRVKASSRLDVGSDLISSSKFAVIQSTSKLNLKPPDLNMDFPRSASLSPVSRGRLKAAGSTAHPGLDPKSPTDSSRSGSVRSSSQAALVDCTLTHSLVSLNQRPGYRPGLGVPLGPNREDQRSPGSPPGFLTPLASSSLITKTMRNCAQDPASSVVTQRNPSCLSHNTSLTQGLTLDSITKKAARPGNESEKEHFSLTESKVGAAGGLDVSQQTMTDNDGVLPGESGRKPGTLLSKLVQLGNANVIPSSRPMGAKEEKKKQLCRKHSDGLESTSSGLPSSAQMSTSKMVKETGTMTERFERPHPWPGGKKDVGVQVEAAVVKCSASESPSLHQEAPASPLIGPSSCQSPLSCIQPLKHICKINIELSEETDVPRKTSSLPACLRTFSFQQNPDLMSELRQNDDVDVSTKSTWEDETGDKEKMQHMKEEHDGYIVRMKKPQQVEWDKHGMTWEVYGASVDLDSFGKAIQSHLESKVRDQEKYIRTLRKSICSISSPRGYKKKKRCRKFLGCCIKGSTMAD